MKKLSKRMQRAKVLMDPSKLYSLDDALAKIQEYAGSAASKFNESVDIVVKLGIDPRQSDQSVRGAVVMPSGLGKSCRVAAIVSEDKVAAAKEAGADIAGSDDLIELIKSGKIDFDVCITTPDMMSRVGALGKVLGPKGLMPNAKLGTLAPDFAHAILQAKAGQVTYKNDKTGLIHASVGKIGFTADALKVNIMALYQSITHLKPSSSKGIYFCGMHLGTTMGPSIKLDLQSVTN